MASLAVNPLFPLRSHAAQPSTEIHDEHAVTNPLTVCLREEEKSMARNGSLYMQIQLQSLMAAARALHKKRPVLPRAIRHFLPGRWVGSKKWRMQLQAQALFFYLIDIAIKEDLFQIRTCSSMVGRKLKPFRTR